MESEPDETAHTHSAEQSKEGGKKEYEKNEFQLESKTEREKKMKQK